MANNGFDQRLIKAPDGKVWMMFAGCAVPKGCEVIAEPMTWADFEKYGYPQRPPLFKIREWDEDYV